MRANASGVARLFPAFTLRETEITGSPRPTIGGVGIVYALFAYRRPLTSLSPIRSTTGLLSLGSATHELIVQRHQIKLQSFPAHALLSDEDKAKVEIQHDQ